MRTMDVPEPPCGTDACREVVDRLVAAAEHRDVIGMAKGVLMATGGCSPEEAFEMLRSASMRENRKLYDVAAELVRRTVARAGPFLDAAPADGDRAHSGQ